MANGRERCAKTTDGEKWTSIRQLTQWVVMHTQMLKIKSGCNKIK